jgi:Do/DeqQ family serine protease
MSANPLAFLAPLVIAFAAAAPTVAQQVPADAVQMRLSFAPVVRKAAPAVVNVYSRVTVRQQVDPFFQMFGMGQGLTRERTAQSLGSGVIVRADGVIVTNNHVVAGGKDIMVALADRREFPARVLFADPHTDVAVLKIDVGAEQLPVLSLAAGAPPQVGDLVLAIGDPFGVGQTVTNGIVSAIARSNLGITDATDFIQTDAAINPGNSGGALVDMAGEMIGMNTAIMSQTGNNTGVGFAIPAALVRHVIDQALSGQTAQGRPWLGVKTQAVTADIARSLGLDRPQGVLVTDVWPGGPADHAGIRSGDLILTINGAAIDDDAALNYRVAMANAGDALNLGVRHDRGAVQTAEVRLAPLPAQPSDEQALSGRNPFDGATVANLTPAQADSMGLDPFDAAKVVVVTHVAGGVSANIGLQPGDLIRAVNGHETGSVETLKATLAQDTGGRWELVIIRSGQTITARLQI